MLNPATIESPRWAERAAEILYGRMEQIDGAAMHDGQVSQDIEEERFTWVKLVADVIAATYRGEEPTEDTRR